MPIRSPFRSARPVPVEHRSNFIHLYFDIEDFDDMDTEDLREVLGSLLDNVAEITVNLAVRTYGIDEGGRILKESTVLV